MEAMGGLPVHRVVQILRQNAAPRRLTLAYLGQGFTPVSPSVPQRTIKQQTRSLGQLSRPGNGEKRGEVSNTPP